ncbi:MULTISPECIES: hydroxymethylbilane synthase [unclassified Novosphingobium]|uniref:hydroxymethylbilane synthase n=1 Tax=unclassified Novosphingobium TaxID=2644732 RepID=UPI000EEA1E02|nr:MULTISPECIES: hydroxymethylbilane synthase [unclassified Novosphingobium]HCF24087.1 hydroxymethylbilane synthase [Novosphingobium sp.]HQV03835.1 hydroxymethylbilane synthase [Novosphingobium sp.]
MPDRPLKLGTRASPLAMAQAHEARDRLCAAHPGLEVEIVPVTASGDKVLDRPLAEIGGKALWTKELDAWLLAGEIDFAVHSLKDVETIRPLAIAIAAILPREDVRDVLVGVESLSALPPGARIGTSAPRRAAQALHARPDCQVVGIRGNVQTRLAKLQAGEADATLLAMAGLNRLGMAHYGTPLDPEVWLPAPGQGAIAIEARAADESTRALLSAIDHAPSHRAVIAERALLAALGGNCHSPIAVLTSQDGGNLTMKAALLSPDGAERVDATTTFAAADLDGPARLAAQLLAQASPAIAAHFDPPES